MKAIIKRALEQAATGLISLVVMILIIATFMWLGAEATEFMNNLPTYTQ